MCIRSYDDHRVTEGARREIPAAWKDVRFTGVLKIGKEVDLYREVDPTQPQYVGTPNPEMDAAWDQLVQRKLKRTIIILTCPGLTIMGSIERIRDSRRGCSDGRGRHGH